MMATAPMPLAVSMSVSHLSPWSPGTPQTPLSGLLGGRFNARHRGFVAPLVKRQRYDESRDRRVPCFFEFLLRAHRAHRGGLSAVYLSPVFVFGSWCESNISKQLH